MARQKSQEQDNAIMDSIRSGSKANNSDLLLDAIAEMLSAMYEKIGSIEKRIENLERA